MLSIRSNNNLSRINYFWFALLLYCMCYIFCSHSSQLCFCYFIYRAYVGIYFSLSLTARGTYKNIECQLPTRVYSLSIPRTQNIFTLELSIHIFSPHRYIYTKIYIIIYDECVLCTFFAFYDRSARAHKRIPYINTFRCV